MKNIIFILSLTLFLGLIISCSDDNGVNHNKTDAPIGNTIGDKLPELLMIDEDGNIVSDSKFRGKYVVYKVWASWCGSCVYSFPKDKEIQDKYKKDVVIVALNIESADKWKSKIDELGLRSLTNLVDNKCVQGEPYPKRLIDYFGVSGIPFYVVVDRFGVIKFISAENPFSRYYDFLEQELEY